MNNRIITAIALGCGSLLNSHYDKQLKYGNVPLEVHVPTVAMWSISGAVLPRLALGAFYGIIFNDLFKKDKERYETEYILYKRRQIPTDDE